MEEDGQYQIAFVESNASHWPGQGNQSGCPIQNVKRFPVGRRRQPRHVWHVDTESNAYHWSVHGSQSGSPVQNVKCFPIGGKGRPSTHHMGRKSANQLEPIQKSELPNDWHEATNLEVPFRIRAIHWLTQGNQSGSPIQKSELPIGRYKATNQLAQFRKSELLIGGTSPLSITMNR